MVNIRWTSLIIFSPCQSNFCEGAALCSEQKEGKMQRIDRREMAKCSSASLCWCCCRSKKGKGIKVHLCNFPSYIIQRQHLKTVGWYLLSVKCFMTIGGWTRKQRIQSWIHYYYFLSLRTPWTIEYKNESIQSQWKSNYNIKTLNRND